jgi:ferrous iron transport protein A
MRLLTPEEQMLGSPNYWLNGEGMTTRKLNQLARGESAVVSHVTGEGAISRRLLEMGVIPGVLVTVLRFAPWGDPMVVDLDGYHLSLRKSEAELVALAL